MNGRPFKISVFIFLLCLASLKGQVLCPNDNSSTDQISQESAQLQDDERAREESSPGSPGAA